jgi:hypothetical protein
MAFLCAIPYAGAGFNAAVVDAPDHAACLIWLPDFQMRVTIGILTMAEALGGYGLKLRAAVTLF